MLKKTGQFLSAAGGKIAAGINAVGDKIGAVKSNAQEQMMLGILMQFLTPDMIANIKEKVLEFIRGRQARDGVKYVVVLEMDDAGHDLQIMIRTRANDDARSLAPFKSLGFSTITADQLTSLLNGAQ